MEPQTIGNYSVERRLAGGGVGEVYLARSRGLHGVVKQVVIKRLRGDRELNGRRVRAFLDEARLAARLNHQNICQVIELGEGDGEFFLVMEHVDGPTLAQLAGVVVKAGASLPHAAAAFIVSQVCAGLQHAHELRDGERSLDVIHRDVSPQNVLISREGEVKLIDFGIAKSALRQERTRAGIIKGKQRYMSPEQARAMRVDHRTDVFSSGVVLYELLVGRRRGQDLPREELARVVRDGVVDVDALRAAAAPDALRAVVERAVQADPAERWPTAGDMGDAVELWLRGEKTAYGRRELGQLVAELLPAAPPQQQRAVVDESVTSETVRETPSSDSREAPDALPETVPVASPREPPSPATEGTSRAQADAPMAQLAARHTMILPPPRVTVPAVALVLLALVGLLYTLARSLSSPSAAKTTKTTKKASVAAASSGDASVVDVSRRRRERAVYAALLEARQRGDHLASTLLFDLLSSNSPYRAQAARGKGALRREAMAARVRAVSALVSRGACAEARWQVRLVQLLSAVDSRAPHAERALAALARRARQCKASQPRAVALKTRPLLRAADGGASAADAGATPSNAKASARQDDWVISHSRIIAGRARRGTPSDDQLRRTIALAQQAYVAGQHRRALLLARRVLRQRRKGALARRALRVLGSAGCQSGDMAAARRAAAQLSARYRMMLLQVCRRSGHRLR